MHCLFGSCIMAQFFLHYNGALLQIAQERSNGCTWICNFKAISEEDC